MPEGRALTQEEARSFYDRFGAMQDLQRFYEDPSIEVLLRHANFEQAKAVVELGSGTGRLAERLLDKHLPEEASYLGVDLSPKMVELAQGRLKSWEPRARVTLAEGQPALPLPDGSCDRFLSTYVLDLLSPEHIEAALKEARRVLAPGGLLCLASLTFGQTGPSRLICRLWTGLHSLSPSLVGGCRPVRLGELTRSWEVVHTEVVCTLGICTELLVAR